jgi:hypothetical protein
MEDGESDELEVGEVEGFGGKEDLDVGGVVENDGF